MKSKEDFTASDVMDLVRRAQDGEREAFDAIYKEYITPIFRFIYFHVSGRKEDAEDITQSVFLRAWDKIDTFEDKGKSFSSWLYTIARNQVIDYWRKKKDVDPEGKEDLFERIADSQKGPAEIYEDKENSQFVYKLLDTLEGEKKDVIIMKFINGLSNKEIAERLDKKEDAVRQIQSRALRLLRDAHIDQNNHEK